jgi:hypothetical protein
VYVPSGTVESLHVVLFVVLAELVPHAGELTLLESVRVM